MPAAQHEPAYSPVGKRANGPTDDSKARFRYTTTTTDRAILRMERQGEAPQIGRDLCHWWCVMVVVRSYETEGKGKGMDGCVGTEAPLSAPSALKADTHPSSGNAIRGPQSV